MQLGTEVKLFAMDYHDQMVLTRLRRKMIVNRRANDRNRLSKWQWKRMVSIGKIEIRTVSYLSWFSNIYLESAVARVP